MSATLMRLRCHECDFAVIVPSSTLRIEHVALSVHFAKTGHSLIRPTTASDLMQHYFVIPDQAAHYSDLRQET